MDYASVTQVPVTVRVTFDVEANAFQSATLYGFVEDVSRADAPAQSLASLVLRDVSHAAGETDGPEFTIRVAVPDPKSVLAVRVHIDVDGDGSYSRGDFITMESYPVLTHGHPDRISVRVRQI